MRLVYKRALIMFSMALNVGFIIMSITMIYQHSKHSHDQTWKKLIDIVYKLDLSATQEKDALDAIKQFADILESHKEEVKLSRRNIFLLLSKSGPVDRNQLHLLIEEADYQEKIQHQAFETHVLKLRGMLGDEKGQLFFSLLLQHLNSEGPPASK